MNLNTRHESNPKLSGAAEARRAHNPEDTGSKPVSAIRIFFLLFDPLLSDVWLPSLFVLLQYVLDATFNIFSSAHHSSHAFPNTFLTINTTFSLLRVNQLYLVLPSPLTSAYLSS